MQAKKSKPLCVNSMDKMCLSLLFTICCFTLFSEEDPKRILVGSPVRQNPAILHEFLESFKRLDQDGYRLDYYFVDDNDSGESSEKLAKFSNECSGKCHIETPVKATESYICTEFTHCWKESLIWRVAAFKDKMIQYALDNNYDYLFLIDSDIVLHPKTISQLRAANKDIISNIFWTAWQPGCMEQPQVWLFDEYTQYPVSAGLTEEEKKTKTYAFFDRLRIPGTYEVGGLGACTLISANAMKKGISFKKIPNLTFWGEDRHFCIRAAAMGIPLFVDTHYPAYHIFRASHLAGVPAFIKQSGSEIREEIKG